MTGEGLPEDDDLRWFNEVYVPQFSNKPAMVADLDQKLARYREEHPEEFEEEEEASGDDG